eukprot:gene25116-biopygen20950
MTTWVPEIGPGPHRGRGERASPSVGASGAPMWHPERAARAGDGIATSASFRLSWYGGDVHPGGDAPARLCYLAYLWNEGEYWHVPRTRPRPPPSPFALATVAITTQLVSGHGNGEMVPGAADCPTRVFFA